MDQLYDLRKEEFGDTRLHKRFDLANQDNHNKYLEKISYKIPLKTLYSVVESSHHNQLQQYCPVLVKIEDEKLIPLIKQDKTISDEDKKNMNHLLQLWDKQGNLVFERNMHKKYIFDDDHFMPDGITCKKQNETGKPCNCNTKLKDKMWITQVRLGEGEEVSRDKIDRKEDDEDDKPQPDHTLFIFLQDEKPVGGGERIYTVVVVVIDDGDDANQEKSQVIEIPLESFDFDEQGLKIIKYLAMAKGNLILADNDDVFYMDLVYNLKRKRRGQEIDTDRLWKSFRVGCKDFEGYKLKGLDDMGLGDAALVLEEQKNCYLTFVKFGKKNGELRLNQIEKPRDPSTQNEDNGNAEDLRTQGVHVEEYKTVIIEEADEFNLKQQCTHFAVARRSDGSIDFYCNFMWVSCFRGRKISKLLANGETTQVEAKVTQIDIDFTQIFWTTEGGVDGEEQNYSNALSWQRLIGPSTCKIKNKAGQIKECEDRRLAQHFKLYSNIVSFNTYFMVVHRNIISIFDLTKQDEDNTNEDDFKVGLQHIDYQDFVTGISLFNPAQYKDEDPISTRPDQVGFDYQHGGLLPNLSPTHTGSQRMNSFISSPQGSPVGKFGQTSMIEDDYQNTSQILGQKDNAPEIEIDHYLLVTVGLNRIEFLKLGDLKPNGDREFEKWKSKKDKDENAQRRRRNSDEKQIEASFISMPPIVSIINDDCRKKQREVYFLMRDCIYTEKHRGELYLKSGIDYQRNLQLVRQQKGECQLVSFSGKKMTKFPLNTPLFDTTQITLYRGKRIMKSLAHAPRDRVKAEMSFIFGVSDVVNAEGNLKKTATYYQLKSGLHSRVGMNDFTSISLEYRCCDNDNHTYYECFCDPPHSLEDQNEGGPVHDNQEQVDELNEIWKQNNKLRLQSISEGKSKMITVFKYIPEHVEGTPSNVNNFSIIEVRTDRIGIFDYEGKLQHVISGVNIRHVHFQDERYLYALQNASRGQVSNKDIKDLLVQNQSEVDENFKTSGLFIYDIKQVVEKQALRIKLSEALVRTNNILSYSSYNRRISYLKDFKYAVCMPLVHRNTLKFIGMDCKSKYLIWHENNGLFTALHGETGQIETWSTVTGKMIDNDRKKEDRNKQGKPDFGKLSPKLKEQLQKVKDKNKGFEVYQKDSGSGGPGLDTTYTEGDYNFCIGGTKQKAEGDRTCPDPKCNQAIMKFTKLTEEMIMNAKTKRNGYSYCTKVAGCEKELYPGQPIYKCTKGKPQCPEFFCETNCVAINISYNLLMKIENVEVKNLADAEAEADATKQRADEGLEDNLDVSDINNRESIINRDGEAVQDNQREEGGQVGNIEVEGEGDADEDEEEGHTQAKEEHSEEDQDEHVQDLAASIKAVRKSYKKKSKDSSKYTYEDKNIPNLIDCKYKGKLHMDFQLSSQQVKQRNFKYISLRRDLNTQEGYKVEEEFSFQHQLNVPEVHLDGPKKGQYKFDFTAPCYPRQSIYMSQDTYRSAEVMFEKGTASIYERNWTRKELEDFERTHILKDGTELWGEQFKDRLNYETEKHDEFIKVQKTKYEKPNLYCKVHGQKKGKLVSVDNLASNKYHSRKCKRSTCNTKFNEQTTDFEMNEDFKHKTVRVCPVAGCTYTTCDTQDDEGNLRCEKYQNLLNELDSSDYRQVGYEEVRTVPSFPQMMCSRSKKNTLFSPNFDYMLNVDINSFNIYIWDVFRERREYDIPKDLLDLTPETSDLPTTSSIKDVASRIHLINDHQFQAITRDNLSVIFDFQQEKLVSTVKIDNMPDKHLMNHHFLDQEKFDQNLVLFRLIRQSQNYKSWLQHGPHLQPYDDVNTCTIFKTMYSIDWSEKWKSPVSLFTSEQSFTVLDWLVANKMIKGRNEQYSLKNNTIPENLIVRLQFNVFPGGQTFLHKIGRALIHQMADKQENKQILKDFEQATKTMKKDQQKNKRDHSKAQDKIAQEKAKQESAAFNKRANDLVDFVFAIVENCLRPENNILQKRYNCQKSIIADVPPTDNKLEIPLTQDVYGDTVLEILLSKQKNENRLSHFNEKFWHCRFLCETDDPNMKMYLYNKNVRKFIENQDPVCIQPQVCASIFKWLKDYSFLHSGYQISEAVVAAVDKDIEGIYDYIDARFITTRHQPAAMQRPYKKQSVFSFINADRDMKDEPIEGAFQQYRAEPFQPWWFTESIKEALFLGDHETKKPRKEMQIEVFDIPYLHTRSEEGYDFIKAIASKEKDIETDATESDPCYSKESIGMLVQYHWQQAKWGVDGFYFMTVLPYIFTMVVYTYWSQYILYPEKGQDHKEELAVKATLSYQDFADFDQAKLSAYWTRIEHYVCGTLVLLYAFYSTVLEVIQYAGDRSLADHFSGEIWNGVDCANIICLLYICITALFKTGAVEPYYWAIQSLSVLIMWGKLIYFMQSFRSVSWLVKMIIESVKSIKSFMYVFILSIWTFAIAFYQHQQWITQVRQKCPGEFSNNSWCNPTQDSLNQDYDAVLKDDWNDLGYTPPEIDESVPSLTQSVINSYLLALGEFSFDDDGVMQDNYGYLSIGWILFFASTLLNFVIMCNLLISIFSSVQEIYAEIAEEEATRQFANLTKDMHQLTSILTPHKTEIANQDVSLLLRVMVKPDKKQIVAEGETEANSFEVDYWEGENEAEVQAQQRQETVESMVKEVEDLTTIMQNHIKTDKRDANVTKRSIISIRDHLKKQ